MISKTIVVNFYQNEAVFVNATVSNLMGKSSIGLVVVRNASVLDAKVIHNSTNESLINKMKR